MLSSTGRAAVRPTPAGPCAGVGRGAGPGLLVPFRMDWGWLSGGCLPFPVTLSAGRQEGLAAWGLFGGDVEEGKAEEGGVKEGSLSQSHSGLVMVQVGFGTPGGGGG